GGARETTDPALCRAARMRANVDRHEPPVFRSGSARAHGDVFPVVLYRHCGGVWDHEHADHRDGPEAARNWNCEGPRGQYRPNHLGFPWPGDNCRALRNADRAGLGNDADPLPERIKSLAGTDVAY